MREGIIQTLQSIELETNVRILLAVESGSRAWGFASPDSDYDVRFIYVHEPDWYLTVFDRRDVMEKMLPGDLDVSGWELRKSLRLFAKCNVALNEWIGSPVLYREAPGFRSELGALTAKFFNPIGATHHYRSMAKQALSDMSSNGHISIKKLLYAIRALLACRWIGRHGSQPPTEFIALVDDVATVEEQEYFGQLLVRKAVTLEKGAIVIEPAYRDAIVSELEVYEQAVLPSDKSAKGSVQTLDAVLRRWVRR